MITCIIPARLGSSRFPGKPLYKIKGKEMILHVIDRAKESIKIDEIVVATEDQDIYDVVTNYGHKCIITEKCPTCTHRVYLCSHMLDRRPDYVVNLQGDEPCMNVTAMDAMIQYAVDHKHQMVQAIYNIDENDLADEDCVKAVVNNNCIIWLSRNPEKEWMINRHIFGISGLYVYDYDTISKFGQYDLRMVEDCASLDTLGFIGKVPVRPFNIQTRTHAVDRLSDIEVVKDEIHRRHRWNNL
jgi:3-deoxy-manno-octulosonate cytidylyltransferase (CMP-KDO synthetase)